MLVMSIILQPEKGSRLKKSPISNTKLQAWRELNVISKASAWRTLNKLWTLWVVSKEVESGWPLPSTLSDANFEIEHCSMLSTAADLWQPRAIWTVGWANEMRFVAASCLYEVSGRCHTAKCGKWFKAVHSPSRKVQIAVQYDVCTLTSI